MVLKSHVLSLDFPESRLESSPTPVQAAGGALIGLPIEHKRTASMFSLPFKPITSGLQGLHLSRFSHSGSVVASGNDVPVSARPTPPSHQPTVFKEPLA